PEIGASVHAAGGNRRIELEGPPAHRDRAAVTLSERQREAPFAEVAPGTDDVADDVDGQRLPAFAHFVLRCATMTARPGGAQAAGSHQARQTIEADFPIVCLAERSARGIRSQGRPHSPFVRTGVLP